MNNHNMMFKNGEFNFSESNNICFSENKYENINNNRNKKIVYIFNILKSRKKEKKYLRKKYNKIISRVHNMDCLLKKIKAYDIFY